MKENKGITLIALVITIIVLIILAGISIAILTGEDGLITKTKAARQNMENATTEEQEILNELYNGLETGKISISYDMLADKQAKINELQAELDILKGNFGENAATSDKILKDYIANVNGQLVTGTIESKAAATYTPGTTDQIIEAGQYLSGIQTIKGDANLKAENIKSGVSIFGIEGTDSGEIALVGSNTTTGNTSSGSASSRSLSYTTPDNDYQCLLVVCSTSAGENGGSSSAGTINMTCNKSASLNTLKRTTIKAAGDSYGNCASLSTAVYLVRNVPKQSTFTMTSSVYYKYAMSIEVYQI